MPRARSSDSGTRKKKQAGSSSVFGNADVEADRALARALKLAGIDRSSHKSPRAKRPQTPQLVQQSTEEAWANAKAPHKLDSEQPAGVTQQPRHRSAEQPEASAPEKPPPKIGLKARLLDELKLGRELTQIAPERPNYETASAEQPDDDLLDALRMRPEPISTQRLVLQHDDEPSPWDFEEEDEGISSALLDMATSPRERLAGFDPTDTLPQFQTQELNGKLMMRSKRTDGPRHATQF